MTKENKFAGLVQAGLQIDVPDKPPPRPEPQHTPSPAPVTTPAGPVVTEPVRMLGGRVPDSIFREFQYSKLEAESALGIRRVTTEEAVEAFVRLLRDETVKARWQEELMTVRRERRQDGV